MSATEDVRNRVSDNIPKKRFFTLKEIAQKLGMSETTFWRWRNDGIFPLPSGPRKKYTYQDFQIILERSKNFGQSVKNS